MRVSKYATVALASFTFALPAHELPALAAAPGADYVDRVSPGLELRDLGRIAPSNMVHLSFNVRYQHQDELDKDVELINTKGSALYHQFLSNRAWNAYFAPAPATVHTAVAELRRAGFSVTSISPDRGLIDAQAHAAVVERYFDTELHNVAQPGAGTRYRHTSPATLPVALRPFIESVTGLNNVQMYHPRPLHARGFSPDKIRGPVKAPDAGFGPKVLANGYDYPVQSGHNGAGHTVGITIAGNIIDPDLAAWVSYFNIQETGTLTREPIDGAHPLIDEETTLNVETITGLAPGANIIIYQFPDWTVQYINDTFNQIVADNSIDSFSNSWAWCETADQSLWDNKSIHRIFKHAVAKGITPIFGSGDDGAFTRGCSGLAVASPADDPYVVGLGGISFTANRKGKLTNQTGWSGSGGGVSVVYPLPAYQKGVPGVLTGGRNVPDIALPGDVEDAFYFRGSWAGPIGGTSWATPAFNAMLVEIDQIRGSRAGWVNADLYKANATFGNAVFADITVGNNGYYSAGPGFDQVTGLGAPQGVGLAKNL